MKLSRFLFRCNVFTIGFIEQQEKNTVKKLQKKRKMQANTISLPNQNQLHIQRQSLLFSVFLIFGH